VEVEGSDLEKSAGFARELRDRMNVIPGAADVRIAQVLDRPALRIDVDRDRAAQVGISQRDVADNVLTTLSSSALVAPSYWLNPKNNVNYLVVVQSPLDKVSSVESLMGMPIAPSATSTGATSARCRGRSRSRWRRSPRRSPRTCGCACAGRARA